MRLSSLVALICVFIASACLAAPGDLNALVQGVREIGAPGIPGCVCAFGDQAFPVVLGKTGRTMTPVVVAARFGRGRVMLMGHNGYLGTGAMKAADTATFMLNAVRWLAAGRPGKPVGVVRSGLLKWLNENGVRAIDVPRGQLAQKLADISVLIIVGSAMPRGTGAAKIVDFVRSGGGLLTADTPWGWRQLNPGKSLAEDHPGQQIVAQMGVCFAGGMTGRTSKNGYAVSPQIEPYTHAGKAFEALQKFEAKQIQLTNAQLQQCSDILVKTVHSLPATEKSFLPRVEAVVEAHQAEAVPSPKKPVTNKQPFARLAIAFRLNRYAKLPPEKIPADPSAKFFPGAVPADAERVTETLTVDCSVPGWHSTGLYAPPGEVITVRADQTALRNGLHIRIGCHRDSIWHHSSWRRVPIITMEKPLQGEVSRYASPFGGLIYVVVPRGKEGTAKVTISGAVRAPYFVLGKTTLWQWRKVVRNYPAPWAEFECDRVILTVRAEDARKVDDPELVMNFWRKVLDADAYLAGRPAERKRPERYVADTQISAGYMHSGYPIMTHLDASYRMVDWNTLHGPARKCAWGLYHEMGHNHQSGDWTFGGTGEVTVNLFSMYVCETVVGLPLEQGHPAITAESQRKKIENYFKEKPSYQRWTRDPFLALILYIQLRKAFGWEVFHRVFAEYRKLPKDQKPKTNQDKIDQFMIRMSRATGHNLAKFFETWGLPLTDKAKQAVADLPEWMPEGFPPATAAAKK